MTKMYYYTLYTLQERDLMTVHEKGFEIIFDQTFWVKEEYCCHSATVLYHFLHWCLATGSSRLI